MAAMSLSHRHIEIFHAIMTFGSVTQAAEYLRTSQPTVSRELKAFETMLGFRLFERQGRRLSATPNAISFHNEVRRSFVGLAEIELAAGAIRDNASRHFEIACMPLFAQSLMPRVCTRYLEAVPGSGITFRTMDHAALAGELLKPDYDFALLEAGIIVEGVSTVEVAVGHEVCVMPAGHHLAGKEIIEPADLVGETAVSLPADDVYRRRYERMFERAGGTWNVVVETGTADAMCALVRSGLGVAIVNPITARTHQGPDLHVRPLSAPIPFVVAICQPPGKLGSEDRDALFEILVGECRSIPVA